MKSDPRKRKFGDRYDGFRVRTLDVFFPVIPYIMQKRDDSQVFFEEKIELSALREFVLAHRKSDIPNLSTMHVIIAAVVRVISQKPRLNRFVSGSKIWSRSYLRLSMAIKRSMDDDGEESIVTPEFEPEDTLHDIVSKLNAKIDEISSTTDDNSTDVAAKLIGGSPGFLRRFIVFVIRRLDAHGLLPKALNRLSPFHSTLFLTNVGSIGIDAVYHHLYNFGTCSIFIAIGKKQTELVRDANGDTATKTFMNVRLVVDERICDGFYYASAIKLFKTYIKHPETLLTPPEKVVYDL